MYIEKYVSVEKQKEILAMVASSSPIKVTSTVIDDNYYTKPYRCAAKPCKVKPYRNSDFCGHSECKNG